MANDIIALREELFATLRGLRSKEDPVAVETAKAVVEVAKVIVDSARVEVDMVKASGAEVGSGFIPIAVAPAPAPAPSSALPSATSVQDVPGGRVITHRLKG